MNVARKELFLSEILYCCGNGQRTTKIPQNFIIIVGVTQEHVRSTALQPSLPAQPYHSLPSAVSVTTNTRNVLFNAL